MMRLLAMLLPCGVHAACPLISSSPYRNEASPFGWAVAPFDFDYANQNDWASRYATCAGLKQSPMDISTSGCPIQSGGADGSLQTAASYTGLQAGTMVNISAYLRTAYAQGKFGSLTLLDQAYQATQVHLTTPSFHSVNGLQYSAEMLILHVPKDQNGLQGSAVVSVLFNTGGASSLFSAMGFGDDLVPISVDLAGSWPALGVIDIPATVAAPLSQTSYFYNGSVPVPPCTENVKWFVLTTPETASQNQIAKLAEALSCYAGGTASRTPIPNPPPATALNSKPGAGSCRDIITNSLRVGGPHDQSTCKAFKQIGPPTFNVNRTAACWDTDLPSSYYSKCLGSPIDIKSSQAHIEAKALPANSFIFYHPVKEVEIVPTDFMLDINPVNRSQVDNYADFGFLMMAGRRFVARKASLKAISSHSYNGLRYAGELNIEHTLFADDVHDLYNMTIIGAGVSGGARRLQGDGVTGDVKHRVWVTIPLTIGAANPFFMSLGAGEAAYSSSVKGGKPYSLSGLFDINASIQTALAGSYSWYSGSLTEPGCSPWGVRWLVFDTPLQISIEQLNLLALPVSGTDSTRVNATVISDYQYSSHVWKNSIPAFAVDNIKGSEQQCGAKDDWNYGNISCWSSSYPICSTGLYQSPIDISAVDVRFQGQDSFIARTAWHPLSGLRVANTARSIGVYNEDMGYVMQIGSNGLPQYYQLTQFNLHMPSQHSLNGRQYAAELVVLHKNQLAAGQLDNQDALAASFFFNVGTNRSLLLDQLLHQAPVLPGQWQQADTPIDLLRSLGPVVDGNFYRYNGSLTTPPCSQTVKWYVFETALNMTLDQWVAFKAMFPNPSNNRPSKPLNGRVIVKNSFMEPGSQSYDFYLNRQAGVSSKAPGPAWIIAPVVGSVMLAAATFYAVLVREGRTVQLEGAGGLTEAGRSARSCNQF